MSPRKPIQISLILKEVKCNPSEKIESDTIEFKNFANEAALHNSKDLTDEISAFANTIGGTIIVGIIDSSDVRDSNWPSQLSGFPCEDITKLKERIEGRLNPKQKLDIYPHEFEGKIYLVINVKRSSDKLVATSSGKFFRRSGRSSVPMTSDDIEKAVKSLQTYDWSSEDIDSAPEEVLDQDSTEEAKSEFLRTRKLPEIETRNFLEAICATKNGVLTKAGVLFLGTEDSIRSLLGNFEYRFSWKTKTGELALNDIWSGNIWQSIKRANFHFSKCNRTIDFDFNEKNYQVSILDSTAFHEAFINSIVHRDYTQDGMVSINFTGDALVITNPGGFYGGITKDNIGLHEPRHRNKALARMMMGYQYVDRAGMGVIRMGLHSLRYGRSFPKFVEGESHIQVTMDAEYFRPSIFVLTSDQNDKYGIPELLILNTVYEKGSVPVEDLIKKLSRLYVDPWPKLMKAVDNADCVELCGTKKGIFIRVKPGWAEYMRVTKIFKVPVTSEKHVKLFLFLHRHGEASNADITEHLEYPHSTQTSRFLKDATYVRRSGSGVAARWSLASKSD